MKKNDARSRPKKKSSSRSLEQIEQERRDRSQNDLKKKFDSTLKHMSEVVKMNEEYNQVRKGLNQAAKSSMRRDGKSRS